MNIGSLSSSSSRVLSRIDSTQSTVTESIVLNLNKCQVVSRLDSSNTIVSGVSGRLLPVPPHLTAIPVLLDISSLG